MQFLELFFYLLIAENTDQVIYFIVNLQFFEKKDIDFYKLYEDI